MIFTKDIPLSTKYVITITFLLLLLFNIITKREIRIISEDILTFIWFVWIVNNVLIIIC